MTSASPTPDRRVYAISVTARCYEQLRIYCTVHNIPARQLVTRLLEPVLSGTEPIQRSTAANGTVSIAIPDHVLSALADQLKRERAAGREVKHGQLLEVAIERMLDELERVPWCRACLQSVGHCGCATTDRNHRRTT